MNRAKLANALFFVSVREQSPQWNVHHGALDGPVVARVTQRYIADPPYIVCFVVNGQDTGEEVVCEDRTQIMDTIIAKIKSGELNVH